MDIKEKVAHLKGLMEGMEYDVSTKEGKIIAGIVDILSDMSDEICEINEDVDALYEYADELDADLGDVESEIFGDLYDDCDCDCDCDDEDCDCDCEGCECDCEDKD